MTRNLKTQIGRVAAGVAALAMVAGATAASAQPYRGGYYGHGYHHGNDAGVAIAGGIVGLALGAAIAGNNNNRYERGYAYAPPPPPPPRYYGGYGYARPYAYGYSGRDCWTTRDYDRYRGEVYERTVCR